MMVLFSPPLNNT